VASLGVDLERALRMSTAPVGVFANAEEQFADDSGVLLVAGARELDVLGTDLAYDEADDDDDGDTTELVDGTVEAVDAFVDEEDWFSIEDGEVDAAEMMAAIDDDDPLGFFGLFLGDADEIEGGDLADELWGFEGDDLILGGDGNDVLDGGEGDDTLDGEAGDDLMRGGEGDDVYTVDSSRDRILELEDEGEDTVVADASFRLPDEVEILVFEGTDDLDGVGNELDNELFGNAGDNQLAGGEGDDLMAGGDGDDTYLVTEEGDEVEEAEAEGDDEVLSSVSFELPDHVEALTLVGRDEIDGTGNDLDNTITGNGRANVIDGGGGADGMAGGRGDDTYVLDDPGDEIEEEARGGVDTVLADGDVDLDDYANVENVELEGTGDHAASGNALANLLVGNEGDNTLEGLFGNDTLEGGDGDDELRGGVGNDDLDGGDGDDLLRGGLGRDLLEGGQGADDFVVGDGLRSRALVADFSQADGDRLLIGDLLSGFDPDTDDLVDFLKLTGKGDTTVVAVDVDGPGRGRAVAVAIVEGDLGTDLATLVSEGVIDLA
jgi:Ca2+-binding RTX toxin-like protein